MLLFPLMLILKKRYNCSTIVYKLSNTFTSIFLRSGSTFENLKELNILKAMDNVQGKKKRKRKETKER